MKNRLELARLFNKLDFKIGAEVGVFDGHYSQVLCQNIPGLKLFGIDPYGVYKGYRDHKFVGSMKKAHDLTGERLAPFDYKLILKMSMDAVKDFADGLLDFVFIDANHSYNWVKDDIREWSRKVRKGGIVAGHDYYKTRTGNVGVIRAVDEYVKEHGYKLELTDWDRDNPTEDDRQPSWYFTK
jgi:Methyltransferase domain